MRNKLPTPAKIEQVHIDTPLTGYSESCGQKTREPADSKSKQQQAYQKGSENLKNSQCGGKSPGLFAPALSPECDSRASHVPGLRTEAAETRGNLSVELLGNIRPKGKWEWPGTDWGVRAEGTVGTRSTRLMGRVLEGRGIFFIFYFFIFKQSGKLLKESNLI